MNRIYLFLLLITSTFVTAQETIQTRDVSSEISEVTVFFEGAQISRKKQIKLGAGTTLLKFQGLSPFIQSKSVRVRGHGELMVLAVNHQQNYLGKQGKTGEIEELEKKLEAVEEEIDVEKAHLEVIAEEISFLKENKDIGGTGEILSVAALRSTVEYYGQKLTELMLANIERKDNLRDLYVKKRELESQVSSMSSSDDQATGEIHVKVSSEHAVTATLELTYIVNNAGWYPSYDLRARTVNEPIQLVYKANLRQDTKVDWDNVALTFSSAQPAISGTAPELRTWFLDFHSRPPSYASIKEVSGVIFDEERKPIPGVRISVKGSTVGTTSDFNGYYSISIPDPASILEYIYIGYETQQFPVTSEVQNVYMRESREELQEVVMESGALKRADLSTELEYKTETSQEEMAIQLPPVQHMQGQTTVSFRIDRPYTVKSDNQDLTVSMASFNIPAKYEYYSVPKIEEEAYLIASLNDWKQYDLLAGEANIFFENTFVGKTVLQTSGTSDSLVVSLGADKNVKVERELVADYTSDKFIGSNKEVVRHWKITIHNNKSEKISMRVLDQVPVSTTDDIKVEILQRSKGKVDEATGEISWNFNLPPSKAEVIDLRYEVKYPKDRRLFVE